VKVCGWRPHDGGAAATVGPAYANLQWRKPRKVWGDLASGAMGISTLAVCCRGALKACLGSDRGGDERGRPIAIGRIGVAQRTTAIESDARASMIIASQEPAKQQGRDGVWPRI
jgi:hypothetical protein